MNLRINRAKIQGLECLRSHKGIQSERQQFYNKC